MVAVEVAVALEVGDDVAIGVGVKIGVADGVDSNAGPSAAETIKFLFNILIIPFASVHLSVTVC